MNRNKLEQDSQEQTRNSIWPRWVERTGKQDTLVLDFEEDNQGGHDLKELKNKENDAKFKVLRSLGEEDIEFMGYYDLFEREVQADELKIAETEAEVDPDYEPVTVDPSTFFSCALIFDGKNNGLEGTGRVDLELSFQSLSEVAVERFLAPKDLKDVLE